MSPAAHGRRRSGSASASCRTTRAARRTSTTRSFCTATARWSKRCRCVRAAECGDPRVWCAEQYRVTFGSARLDWKGVSVSVTENSLLDLTDDELDALFRSGGVGGVSNGGGDGEGVVGLEHEDGSGTGGLG